MAEVQFDGINARGDSACGGSGELVGHVPDVALVERFRNAPFGTGCHRARSDPPPWRAVGKMHIFKRERLPALPERLGTRLAPGMCQLHANRHSLVMDEIDDTLEWFDLII